MISLRVCSKQNNAAPKMSIPQSLELRNMLHDMKKGIYLANVIKDMDLKIE